MRVAIIQSDERRDFAALQLARALRQRGHAVTLIVPQSHPAEFAEAHRWMAEGFAWLPAASGRSLPEKANFPRDRGLGAARGLSGILQAFNVAWFFEHHWAMPTLRDRKFRDRLLPLVVLVEQPQPEEIPNSIDNMNRSDFSRYALQWADLICNRHTGIPQAETLWQQRRDAPARPIRQPLTSPAVTVCIPYFEAPQLLPKTLQSLERQTSQDFTVVAVDDGSCTPEARQGFDECAARYSARGWKFLRQANLFPGAARNRAAQESASEFLLFLDADDIAMPGMVERFLRAALLSGDDCLVAPNYGFTDDPEGECALLFDPPGSLIGSMGDDMHGGSCIFVRRESFGAIGGFTELRGVGYEDYEFHVRCELAGLKWDVLPELIYRYRMPSGGGNVSLFTSQYANQARVLRWYEERLKGSGLRQLPLAFASVFRRADSAHHRIVDLEYAAAQRFPRRMGRPGELRLLMLTSYFPFGVKSGWHIRLQQMIRYLGSRYQLTLVAPMVREQLAPVRKEAFRYLKAIRGVEGSRRSAVGSEGLPFRVRQMFTDTLCAALRDLNTSDYHATLIDQIFMAEFRKLVDSPVVLTEHNIESRLLRQASEHSWNYALPEDYRNAGAEAVHLEQYENSAWPEFPVRAVVSEADRDLMNRRSPGGTTVVAPNGASLSSWLPRGKRATATILFPANLSYPPNVDAVELLLERIWPGVRHRIPTARLILAGREPAEPVRAAAGRAGGVELCANPDSMDRVARRASITVVPLRLGSGTRCKILESLAWGLPVVSTTLGAEGIDAEDGEHLLIRDDPDAFAEAVCRLMSDEALWQKLRRNGRELVRERYSWDRVFEPLEDALIELVS